MKRMIIFVIVFVHMFIAFITISNAENVASFNLNTGTLNIPKVKVGSDYYQVIMQYNNDNR
mgnify:CR=1 FL=1